MSITKKLILTLALSSVSIYASTVHANEENNHKGHDHAKHEHNESSCSHRYDKLKNEVSKEAIEKAAMQEVKNLVAQKKIHKSWADTSISKIGKTHYGDTNDWLVGFENKLIKNEKRQTLYIFVSVHGKIRGANYTGN
jgi:hypothetical protein